MKLQKWNELDKKKKIMIGVGSALVVTAAGTGAVIAGNSAEDAKIANDDTEKEKNKDTEKVSLKEKENKKEKEDVELNEEEENKIPDTDGKEEEEEEEETKESVEEKEDGTTVTTKQTTSSTPTATVKVEKPKSNTAQATVKKDSPSKPASKPKPQPKITTKTTTSTESIPFKTVNQNDSSLEKGKTKVIKEGKNGVRTITYKETYTDGKLTKKEETGSKVTTNPVDKVVAVGTKAPAPTYQTASQAHSILGGSGMSKSGSQYSLNVGSYGQSVRTTVGGNHVTSIYFHPNAYIVYKSDSKEMLIELLGKEEGIKEYEAGQKIVKQIERAVRASANAVYGSGTSKANQLYNQIINSKSPISKSF